MSLSGFRDREDASRQAVRSDVRAWVRGPVSGGAGVPVPRVGRSDLPGTRRHRGYGRCRGAQGLPRSAPAAVRRQRTPRVVPGW